MTSVPVWQLCHHFQLTIMNECFCFCLGIFQNTTTQKNYFFKANKSAFIEKDVFLIIEGHPPENMGFGAHVGPLWAENLRLLWALLLV